MRGVGPEQQGPTVRAPLSLTPSSRQAGLLLAAAFVTFAVGAACMHSYTVFLVAFIEAFGWSRGESSIAYSVSQLVSGATSPLVGIWWTGSGPRRLVLIGGCLLAAGLLASAFADALWQVIVLYGVVMTLGANCLGPGGVRADPVTPICAQPRHGGGGRAVGQWLRPRLLGAAVAAVDRRPGLARRLPRAGRLHGGGLPAAGRTVRGSDRSARTAGGAAPRAGLDIAPAIRTPHFWLLFLVYVFTGLGSFLVALHQLAFAVDHRLRQAIRGRGPRALARSCRCRASSSPAPCRITSDASCPRW